MKLEIADSFWKKARGLMFRKPLGKEEGMLFVFKKECRPRFWMFGMRFPLDIVFMDKNREVVDIKKNCPPLTLNPRTWKTYRPIRPSMYVLEVTAGTSVKIRPRRSSGRGSSG